MTDRSEAEIEQLMNAKMKRRPSVLETILVVLPFGMIYLAASPDTTGIQAYVVGILAGAALLFAGVSITLDRAAEVVTILEHSINND